MSFRRIDITFGDLGGLHPRPASIGGRISDRTEPGTRTRQHSLDSSNFNSRNLISFRSKVISFVLSKSDLSLFFP